MERISSFTSHHHSLLHIMSAHPNASRNPPFSVYMTHGPSESASTNQPSKWHATESDPETTETGKNRIVGLSVLSLGFMSRLRECSPQWLQRAGDAKLGGNLEPKQGRMMIGSTPCTRTIDTLLKKPFKLLCSPAKLYRSC
jgi:hypothetical protein